MRREDGERVLETTRLSEEGVEGSGVPRAYVLGKGLRAPRGWELAISSERLHDYSPCVQAVRACLLEVHVAHKRCLLPLFLTIFRWQCAVGPKGERALLPSIDLIAQWVRGY